MAENNKDEVFQVSSLSDFIKSEMAEDIGPADVVEPEVKEKSPLEKMKEYKDSHPGTIVKKEDITYDNEKKVLKNSIENDRREDEYNQYLGEMDDLIKTAQSVNVTRAPKNGIEAAAMIDELDQISRQNSGKVYSNPVGRDIDPATKEKTVLKIEEAGTSGKKMDVPDGMYNGTFFSEKTGDDKNKSSKSDVEDIEIPEDTKKEMDKVNKEEKEREELVTILIDKTGFGGSEINFSDEEKDKISKATEIRLTEVTKTEIPTIKFISPKKSYAETISASDHAFGTTTVPLVGSRYRAKMKGLGYGQLGDLLINTENPTFEQFHKRFSIIYNNIVSTTVGKFETFEDFLKNTAYDDMNILLYGLMVSTYPEIDSVTMTCGRCKKPFDQKYVVRDLMSLNSASLTYLKQLDQLMDCKAENFQEFYEGSPVHMRKMIKLPYSGYYMEFGLVSAYDYLYTIIENLLADDFNEKYPGGLAGFMGDNVRFLTIVRSVSIPDGEGNYIKYDTFDDILQIIYNIAPDDVPVINSIISQYVDAYTFQFSIKNSTCPHCGNTAKENSVDLNSLLFLKVAALRNTTARVENTLSFLM